MEQTRKILPLTTAAIGALLLAGCGAGDTDQSASISPENEATRQIADNPADGSAAPSASASQAPTGSASPELTASQQAALTAVDTALGDYRGGQAVELDYDDTDDTFEVDVVHEGSKHRVTTDGTGRNITGDDDEGSVNDKDTGTYGRVSLDLQEALRRAFQEAAENQGEDAVVDGVSLQEQGDNVRWQVELKSGGQDLDYLVNANTGSIQPKD